MWQRESAMGLTRAKCILHEVVRMFFTINEPHGIVFDETLVHGLVQAVARYSLLRHLFSLLLRTCNGPAWLAFGINALRETQRIKI